jgi:hypothetical protein
LHDKATTTVSANKMTVVVAFHARSRQPAALSLPATGPSGDALRYAFGHAVELILI